jgi:queuosine precursor transporter
MVSVLLYLSGIVAANILVHTFGIIQIGALMLPAGAVMIGLTFSFRDMVQQRHGKWQCWIWMFVASAITLLFNPQLALASVSAFLIAEFLDWAIFTFSGGTFQRRLVLSNLIGTPVDSLVFVTLAFGFYWPAIWGQTLVKFASSLIVLIAMRHPNRAITH